MDALRLARKQVEVAAVTETAASVSRRMLRRNVGTVVVTDGEDRPIGIVTDRDLVQRVMAEGRDPSATLLRAVMTPHPRTVLHDAPVEKALAEMTAARVRRIPVVDTDGRLVGVLSLDDVLRELASRITSVADVVSTQMPRQPEPPRDIPPRAARERVSREA